MCGLIKTRAQTRRKASSRILPGQREIECIEKKKEKENLTSPRAPSRACACHMVETPATAGSNVAITAKRIVLPSEEIIYVTERGQKKQSDKAHGEL